MKHDIPPWLPPNLHGRLALRPAEAAEALGICRETLQAELLSGRLQSKKMGHARLIPIAAIIKWLENDRV